MFTDDSENEGNSLNNNSVTSDDHLLESDKMLINRINPSNNTASVTSDRKRSRGNILDDSSFDDILGQITAKLTILNTKEDTAVEEDNIIAFVEVLKCSRSEAQFYLESSAGNIQTAILLWIENNPPNNRYYSSIDYNPFKSRIGFEDHILYNNGTNFINTIYDHSLTTTSNNDLLLPLPRYMEREVIIQDLHPDWYAKVHSRTGQVYFIHRPTGYSQNMVPPGYAEYDYTVGVISSDVCHGNGIRSENQHHQQQQQQIPSNIVLNNENNNERYFSASVLSIPPRPFPNFVSHSYQQQHHYNRNTTCSPSHQFDSDIVTIAANEDTLYNNLQTSSSSSSSSALNCNILPMNDYNSAEDLSRCQSAIEQSHSENNYSNSYISQDFVLSQPTTTTTDATTKNKNVSFDGSNIENK